MNRDIIKKIIGIDIKFLNENNQEKTVKVTDISNAELEIIRDYDIWGNVNNKKIKISYTSNSLPICVKGVNVIVPDKVVEVTFADGTKEKSVCREPDVFSLESAISICISKKIMGGSSAYNNAIKRGMKVYEDKQKREAAEKAEQERIEKKRAKRLAYKERRAAKKREEQITIQAEAYLRAMDIMKNENRGA